MPTLHIPRNASKWRKIEDTSSTVCNESPVTNIKMVANKSWFCMNYKLLKVPIREAYKCNTNCEYRSNPVKWPEKAGKSEELLRFPDFLFWRRHGHSLQNLVETSRWNTGTDCKNVKVTSPHSFKPRGPFIANPVERRPKSSGGCWNFLASHTHSLKTRKPTCIFCIQKHNIRYPLQSILAPGSNLRSQRTGSPIFKSFEYTAAVLWDLRLLQRARMDCNRSDQHPLWCSLVQL